MSRFYMDATCSKSNSSSTKGGLKDLFVHTRGYNVGVLVECAIDPVGDDVIRVYSTRGSNDPEKDKLLAELSGAPK